jgi:hypothetical protein
LTCSLRPSFSCRSAPSSALRRALLTTGMFVIARARAAYLPGPRKREQSVRSCRLAC